MLERKGWMPKKQFSISYGLRPGNMNYSPINLIQSPIIPALKENCSSPFGFCSFPPQISLFNINGSQLPLGIQR